MQVESIYAGKTEEEDAIEEQSFSQCQNNKAIRCLETEAPDKASDFVPDHTHFWFSLPFIRETGAHGAYDRVVHVYADVAHASDRVKYSGRRLHISTSM